MEVLFSLLSLVLVCLGLFFFVGAAAGLVRFPDFYTRMHAAGKGDTLSTVLILSGIAIHVMQDWSPGTGLVALKILGIAAMIMLASPTSTHVLMNAGFEDEVRSGKLEPPPGPGEAAAEDDA